MTHLVLITQTLDPSIKEMAQFKLEYAFHGRFYEHSSNTAGFVFSEQDLESYILKCGHDPLQGETSIPKNWADEFSQNINLKYVAFLSSTQPKRGSSLANYKCLEVYRKAR